MMKSHSKEGESCNYALFFSPKKGGEQRDCFTYMSEGHTNKDWSGTFLFMTIDLSAIAIVANLEIT